MVIHGQDEIEVVTVAESVENTVCCCASAFVRFHEGQRSAFSANKGMSVFF